MYFKVNIICVFLVELVGVDGDGFVYVLGYGGYVWGVVVICFFVCSFKKYILNRNENIGYF